MKEFPGVDAAHLFHPPPRNIWSQSSTCVPHRLAAGQKQDSVLAPASGKSNPAVGAILKLPGPVRAVLLDKRALGWLDGLWRGKWFNTVVLNAGG